VQHLAAANGACGARAEGDQGANSAGAGVGGVDDAEGAEHALSLTTVLGDLARGPGGLGGAAEVGAVVPGGGGVAVDGGRVRDLGRGPVRGEEGLEVQDVVELHRWDTRGVREAAGSRAVFQRTAWIQESRLSFLRSLLCTTAFHLQSSPNAAARTRRLQLITLCALSAGFRVVCAHHVGFANLGASRLFIED
jgi:hypothetical protein